MKGWIVRDARMEDLDEVLRLWVQMARFHSELDPRLGMRTDAEGQASMRSYLQSRLESPDSRLFVAEGPDGRGLAGYLLAHIRAVSPIAIPTTAGYVSDICVDERARRQGIGRTLFLAAKAWFKERGQSVIRLNVAAANPASRAFWRKMGASELMILMAIENS